MLILEKERKTKGDFKMKNKKDSLSKYLDEIIEEFTATPRVDLLVVNYSLRPYKKDEENGEPCFKLFEEN